MAQDEILRLRTKADCLKFGSAARIAVAYSATAGTSRQTLEVLEQIPQEHTIDKPARPSKNSNSKRSQIHR